MKSLLLAAGLGFGFASAALAAPETYELDASHSQIVFSYDHLGFSTTTGVISGFDGTIVFDAEDPEASSVEVSFPIDLFWTGWDERDAHLLGEDFLTSSGAEEVTFVSTAIEVTGENTANITGDLTINGQTQSVVLDTVLNQAGDHPMQNRPWLGFDATTTILRSAFDAGDFAPYIGDEVQISISIEAAASAE